MNIERDSSYLIAFGNHLRVLRKRKGFTIQKLSLLAGIEYRQVSDIERAKINTTVLTIRAIAKALEVPEKDMFDFTE